MSKEQFDEFYADVLDKNEIMFWVNKDTCIFIGYVLDNVTGAPIINGSTN